MSVGWAFNVDRTTHQQTVIPWCTHIFEFMLRFRFIEPLLTNYVFSIKFFVFILFSSFHKIHSQCRVFEPQSHWFSLQSFSHLPANVRIFSLNPRSSSEFFIFWFNFCCFYGCCCCCWPLTSRFLHTFCRFDPIAVCMRSFHSFTLFPIASLC